ncbi:LysM peptidoglycan-binding domain-containing protein, partial [Syntrophorhabdus aromaticivorans]|uniref:LysM peptidoglycan-binding domain-containing protein n=1 Tax=Syntrophorhabdus aromaticivorans TaxID=328301 RepID=UPI0018DC7A65
MAGINKSTVNLTNRLIDIMYGKPITVVSTIQTLHDMNPGSDSAVQTSAEFANIAAGMVQVAMTFGKVAVPSLAVSGTAFGANIVKVSDKLRKHQTVTTSDWENLASSAAAFWGDATMVPAPEIGIPLKAISVALAGMAVLSGSAPSSTQASFDAAAQQFADKRGQIAPTPDGDIALYDVIPGEKADSLLGNDTAYVAKVIAISAEGVTYWLEDDGSGSLTISRTTPDGQYAPLVPDDIQQATTEGTYTVDVDDNLPDIAEKFHTSVEKIMELNPEITDPGDIYEGQEIILPTTNLFSLTNTTDFNPTLEAPIDQQQITLQVQANKLICNGVTVAVSLLGDVNTDPWNQAIANYSITDGYRPANNTTGSGNPFTQFSLLTPEAWAAILPSATMSNSTQNLITTIPADPLVLDLNGDGVKLTDFSSNPVLFDADHDGAREQTGWVSPEDGILVKDLNANGIIDNISETLSEYFGGTAGTGGSPGTKPYHDGFAALKSLDSNNDNVFNASDTDWNSVKVWVDANHDGKSWIDTDGDGIKGAGEATELKALTELGITSINLSPTTQSGLVRDGNEILASGTFTLNGQTKEALAANFLYNPNGHTFTASGNGTVITTQGEIPADVVIAYSSRSSTGETMDVAVKGVRNAYGHTGDDTLIGDANNNVLAGGPGSDTFNAGAGDDVLLVDAEDLQENIHAGDGLD